jgi:hypothetical protein
MPTTADSKGRILIPKTIAEQIPWLRGQTPIPAWLFLLSNGRYCLLTDEQVAADDLLAPIRELLASGSTETFLPSQAGPPARSASAARLLPVTITPPKPGWRISTNKMFQALAPRGSQSTNFTILLSLEGLWELWYTDILREAAATPLNDIASQ